MGQDHSVGGRDMLVSFATVVLASNLVTAAVNEIPQFNLDQACRAAAVPGLGTGRTIDACKRDELEARDAIIKQWTQLPPADSSPPWVDCRATLSF